MTTDATILMTGAGAPGASGIVKSLRKADDLSPRLVGVDMDSDAYGFTLVDEGYTVPGGRESGYVDRMLELVAAEDVDVVLPLTNPELEPLAADREAFEAEGATVMVSPPDALATANDKGALYAFLAERGFEAAPEFRRVDSRDAFVDACSALGYPERPVCFKRPVASGKRGFRTLDPAADRLDLLLHEKPDSSVTTLEDVLPILERAESFPELVVMEYLPGTEYSVDALARGDACEPVVPRSREETRAGISFGGTVERDEELIEYARDICRELGLEYNVNLQFKRDVDGRPKLIEINPRVAGTIVMCVGAGANLPALAVQYALGEPVPSVDVQWGTQMSRYWQERFVAPDGTTFHLGRDGERT